jgi:hypothetical protein
MSTSNPILALAERAVREQFSPERIAQESERLMAQGISG